MSSCPSEWVTSGLIAMIKVQYLQGATFMFANKMGLDLYWLSFSNIDDQSIHLNRMKLHPSKSNAVVWDNFGSVQYNMVALNFNIDQSVNLQIKCYNSPSGVSCWMFIVNICMKSCLITEVGDTINCGISKVPLLRCGENCALSVLHNCKWKNKDMQTFGFRFLQLISI